jgi:hypothetical protein
MVSLGVVIIAAVVLAGTISFTHANDYSLPIHAGTVIKTFPHTTKFIIITARGGGSVNTTLRYAGFLLSFKQGEHLVGSFSETRSTAIGIIPVKQPVQGFSGNVIVPFNSDITTYSISKLVTNASFDYSTSGNPLTFELYFGEWVQNSSIQFNDTITVVQTIEVVNGAVGATTALSCGAIFSLPAWQKKTL